MSAKITPSVGRVVWFHPAHSDRIAVVERGIPLAAIIAAVWSDTCVNLAIFDANGNTHSRTSVLLVDEKMPAPEANYAEWMPYQKGQAAKTEALEGKLAEQAASPFAAPILVDLARKLCGEIERLPAGRQASNLSALAGHLYHGIQQLHETGKHYWPNPIVLANEPWPSEGEGA